ncbi:MAG: hypothetical protein K2I03_12310 [Lachnospiraceae bacterium]|nr:hypothetical protein [Lachnospiraceae bacterium]
MLQEVTAPAFTLTEEMFKPLTTAVTSNLPVLVAVGIVIFGAVASVGIIPKVIKKFI